MIVLASISGTVFSIRSLKHSLKQDFLSLNSNAGGAVSLNNSKQCAQAESLGMPMSKANWQRCQIGYSEAHARLTDRASSRAGYSVIASIWRFAHRTSEAPAVCGEMLFFYRNQ